MDVIFCDTYDDAMVYILAVPTPKKGKHDDPRLSLCRGRYPDNSFMGGVHYRFNFLTQPHFKN